MEPKDSQGGALDKEIEKIFIKNIFESLREKGFFKKYKSFEEYQNRGNENKAVVDLDEQKEIKENRRRAAEIENLIKNYNPCSTEEYCRRHNIN